MRKRLFIGIAIILIGGLSVAIYLIFRTEMLKEIPGVKAARDVTAVRPPDHSGHDNAKKTETSGAATKDTGPGPLIQGNQAEEAPLVEIPSDKQQLIGLKTVAVLFKPLSKIIRTVGRIEYDERRVSTINTKFEGWVERLYVDYTGRFVKKGEPLAEVYSPELYATQKEFLNLLKWKLNSGLRTEDTMLGKMLSKDTDTLVDAARQRLKLWDISDSQIKKIEEAGEPIRTLTIYSPVDGFVIEKMALQGMRIMPGEKLFNIADLSTLWVIADIYEYEIPLVRLGQKAMISLSHLQGKKFTANIDYIYPLLSGATRTAKVRFQILNTGGQLRPEMFTDVEIRVDLGKRLAVPEDAIIDTGNRQIVYLDKGDGFFEPREVMTGLKAEGVVEIVRGLKAGDKVASSATFLIDSEAQLKGVRPLSGHKH